MLAGLQSWLRSTLLWLFFFNAVLDRVCSFFLGVTVFTNLFYACLAMGLALHLALWLHAGGRASRTQLAALLFLGFAFVLGAVYGDIIASVHGIKQFFLGVVVLVLFADQPPTPRRMLLPVLIVQAYALFQGVYFLTHGLQLPPWDMAYVNEAMATQQAENLFVDGLVRLFSTFASFFEYQVSVHAIAVGLFLTRHAYDASTRRLTIAALFATLAADAILPDRTPIMLAAITCVVAWCGTYLVFAARERPRRLVVGLAMVGLVGLSFVLIPALWIDSTNPLLRRLAESFRFWQAETVQHRVTENWGPAVATVRWHPEGVGPAEVATAYNPNAQVPHNNFLLFAIGYSVLFPFVYFSFIAFAFGRLFRGITSHSEMLSRLAFTSIGLVVAYAIAGQFNSPFSSYPGVALFLVLATLYRAADRLRASDWVGDRSRMIAAVALNNTT